MFSPEQFYYQKVLGIRKEFNGLNPVSAGLLIGKSLIHVKTHGSKIEGHPLPDTDSGLIVINHNYEGDNYKICIAGVKAGRLIRPVVKKGLIERSFSESDKYLESIEAQDDTLQYKALNAYVLKGISSIGIDRENPDGRTFFKETDQVIESGQLLGMFIEPHRYKDNLLKHLQKGAAVLARRHPDLPIYLCACSSPLYGEDRVYIFEPFTYNQLLKEWGRKINTAELTILFADTIVTELPRHAQQDWRTRRALEIERLAA